MAHADLLNLLPQPVTRPPCLSLHFCCSSSPCHPFPCPPACLLPSAPAVLLCCPAWQAELDAAQEELAAAEERLQVAAEHLAEEESDFEKDSRDLAALRRELAATKAALVETRVRLSKQEARLAGVPPESCGALAMPPPAGASSGGDAGGADACASCDCSGADACQAAVLDLQQCQEQLGLQAEKLGAEAASADDGCSLEKEQLAETLRRIAELREERAELEDRWAGGAVWEQ